MPDAFEELLLEKFDNAEVYSYVSKVLRVVAGMKADDAKLAAQRFVEQTRTSAADLRQNPLMLGLMAFLFANKGDVPSNRPEIYRECAMLMFEKWDQNRNIRAEIPAGFDLLHLFSHIASEIYGRSDLEDGVSENWLLRINKAYFADQFESKIKSNEAARNVTAFVKGRSWVMSEFGADVYRFTHRTFLEYFFARHLDEIHDTVGDLMAVIVSEVKQNHWDVIAHLALQIKTTRNQRRTSQAMSLLSQSLHNEVNSGGGISLASFAASSLSYLSGPESDLRSLLQSIYQSLLTIGQSNFSLSLSIIALCARIQPDRKDYVTATLASFLESSICGSNESARNFAISLVSSTANFAHFAPSDLLLPEDLSSRVRHNVKDVVQYNAQVSGFYAGLYWEWYRESFSQLFEIHGLSMLASDERYVEWPSFYLDPALIALRRVVAPDRGIQSRLSWADQMRVIGRHGNLASLQGIKSLPTKRPFRSPLIAWQLGLQRAAKEPDLIRGVLMCLILYLHLILRANSVKSHNVVDGFVAGKRDTLGIDAKAVSIFVEEVLSSFADRETRFNFWYDSKAGLLKLMFV